jgi:hypothetical protein
MKVFSFGAAAACLVIGHHAAIAQDRIGIAVCDEFLTKYDACMKDKPAEQKKDRLHATIAEQRVRWKANAANPQFKVTTETSCRMTAEMLNMSLTSPPNSCKM